MDNRAIGMFDSGIGGLTVVKEVINQLPNENIIYFGDTARVPYGSKTKETITKYSRQIIKFLLSKNVKAVIIACNTASSNCLEIMKKEFDFLPIIGVIESGAYVAAKTTTNNKVGIIGTESTIKSGEYQKFINILNSNIEVYHQACPLFVPLVEEGWIDGQIVEEIIQKYLKDILTKDIDTLVLGCTHYPLLTASIKKVVTDKIKLVNPAVRTAYQLQEQLNKLSLLNKSQSNPEYKFYVSDITTKFETMALNIFNKIYIPEKIDIDKC